MKKAMDIKQIYREETELSVYKDDVLNVENFSNEYVKWLEAKLNLTDVSKRYFLFSGQENGKATKYLVDDCDDRETAIAKIETEYPNFKWAMTETFNAC